jgi:hypothetical protein
MRGESKMDPNDQSTDIKSENADVKSHKRGHLKTGSRDSDMSIDLFDIAPRPPSKRTKTAPPQGDGMVTYQSEDEDAKYESSVSEFIPPSLAAKKNGYVNEAGEVSMFSQEYA